MSLLPLFLDLHGKRVLVVGGGSVARAKVQALRPTGCHLRVVSLAFAPTFLEALKGFEVERLDRAFHPEDLDGVHLVISATNDPEANTFIAAHARSLGLWVNAVDDAASCDALFPSILRRGPFVAAISTEGAFAGLSRVVREALDPASPVVRARLASQMPVDAKRKFAQFVIDTSGTKEDTLLQTEAVYAALRSI